MTMSYSIIFTIGRMNPPTPGHFDLIEKLFNQAIKHRIRHIHIILSSKTDKIRNPLEPELRRDFIYEYMIPHIKRKLISLYNDKEIENIAVDILLTHEHSRYLPNDIYATVSYLLTPIRKDKKALFITGYKSTFSFSKQVDILRIPRTNPISGTLVRTLAFQYPDIFRHLYCDYNIDDADLDILYEDILLLEPPNAHQKAAAAEYVRTVGL